MPALLAWLGALLETRLGSWLIQALATLGVSFVTYKVGVEPFRNLLVEHLASMPAMFANVIGYLWIDRALTMIMSAAAAKEATNGMRAVLTKKGATA